MSQPGGFEKGGWFGAFNTTQSSYHVAAESAADIAAAVRFAKQRSLRLAVKNTGHECLGCSMSGEALMIWTRPMQDLKFEESFRPAGCTATTADILWEARV